MPGNFEIDEDGLVKAEIGIRGILGRKDRVVHLVNRAGRAAEVTMKLYAPEGNTGAFKRSIGKSLPEFRPGGAGGGGVWTVVVGVQDTPEIRDRHGYAYPTNVFQGTGVFGPRGHWIKTEPGNVMVIKDWRGENLRARDVDRGTGSVLGGRRGRLVARTGTIFTHQVEGQMPQREWYDAGRDRAQMVISSNFHRIFNIHDSMDDI